MNNDAPKNGDFAAYLENLGKQGSTSMLHNPVSDHDQPSFQYSQKLTDQANLRAQELAELPPISDDDLLAQALASAGENNEYDLNEETGDNADNVDLDAQARPPSYPEAEQEDLAFLGEHALNLADQASPEELNGLPPISEEELIQQALANPADGDDFDKLKA